MTAEQALAGSAGIALLILAALGLHTLQVRLERWAGNRPERQGRRSLMRDLFAVTTIGLLAVAVAFLIAPSAKGLRGAPGGSTAVTGAQHHIVDRFNVG